MFYHGRGVPYDYSEAADWLWEAADQGDADAQFSLGLMYGHGEGVPQDNVTALLWFNLAVAQGHEQAAKNQKVASEFMTPTEIAKAESLAREWMEKHGKAK